MRRLIPLSLLFFVLVALLNVAVRVGCQVAGRHCAAYWPISIVQPRLLTLPELFLLIAAALVVALALPWLRSRRYPLPAVAAVGGGVMLLTTLSQGGAEGFARPVAGCGRECIQYYHEALAIQSPAAFLRDFTALQPTLNVHSATHPPGTVLLYWTLDRLLPSPVWVGLALTVAAVALTIPALVTLLRHEVDGAWRVGAGILLFLLLPAVQIYYAAALDGLIAGLLLVAVVAFRYGRGAAGSVVALLALAWAASLTFAWLFALPVLLLSAWQQDRWVRLVAVLGNMALIGIVAWGLTGFDYLAAFRIASALENPLGFRLIADPLAYLVTRAEGLLEFALFGGPALLLAAATGWRRLAPPGRWLALVAVGTWIAMLATGAYRTGESARACLYLYPYLILPATVTLDEPSASRVIALTAAQAILMQGAATYFW